MPAKTSFVVAAGVVAVLIACSGGKGEDVAAPREIEHAADAASSGSPDAGSPEAPRVDDPLHDAGPSHDPFSFSPLTANRACARDEDCVLIESLSYCRSCCGQGAVARGEAEEAYAAVVKACQGPGAPAFGQCDMGCNAKRAACFEATCVMLPDLDAGYWPFPTSCPTASADGGAAAPELGPGPACGARAAKTGFEEGLDPAWTTTNAAAVRVDRSDPLAGSASLRVSYRQDSGAYLTIPQPDACAIRLAFTMRTRLLANGLTLARIVAGDGWWFHVRVDHCSLTVAEEIRTADAVSMGFGGEGWPIPADTPVRVVLTVDLRAKTITTAAAPLGEPLPAPRTTGMRGLPSGNGAIKTIELGGAPGVVNTAVGIVDIDDLVID